MDPLSPAGIFALLATEIPAQQQDNMIVIGSLAAAYHFFREDEGRGVRTKDVDCLLAPRAAAIPCGEAMVEALLDSDWTFRTEGGFGTPQPTPEPLDKLSAIRLQPPGSKSWFLELLTVPESETDRGKKWIALSVRGGYFGLCSFEFLSLAAQDPLPSKFGIRFARPEMMALANLLSHPRVGHEYMIADYGGRQIKRTAKDLGRLLAIAWLSGLEGIEDWASAWEAALSTCFPKRWRQLALDAGTGLTALMASEDDFEQAYHTCIYGLLSGLQVSSVQLQATAARVVQFAILPLAAQAR